MFCSFFANAVIVFKMTSSFNRSSFKFFVDTLNSFNGTKRTSARAVIFKSRYMFFSALIKRKFLYSLRSSVLDSHAESVLHVFMWDAAFCPGCENPGWKYESDSDHFILLAADGPTFSCKQLSVPSTLRPIRPPRAGSRLLQTVSSRSASYRSGIPRFLRRASTILRKSKLEKDFQHPTKDYHEHIYHSMYAEIRGAFI